MQRIDVMLLVAALFATASCSDSGLGGLIDRSTPRQAYVHSLQKAGLGETALVRDWMATAEEALRNPQAATLPLVNQVKHEPSQPRAYGYRLQLKRGRVLRVQLTVAAAAPALVFLELFDTTDTAKPIASADRTETSLSYEVETDGTYILRIQPELLRGGALEINQRTVAALTFPVEGRGGAAVKSYFLDPRDNNRRDHHGIDIFAPRGTAVLAAAAGIVTHVGTSTLGGNVVWVWDPVRGQSHYYAHLSQQAVTTGMRLEAGHVVGYVGNTGNARTTPPHLHFGIYSRGEGPINPLPFVTE